MKRDTSHQPDKQSIYSLYLRYTMLLIFIATAIYSCNNRHKIGTIKVNGVDEVYFSLYQESRLDKVHSVDYQILGKNHKITDKSKHLTGTNIPREKLDMFHAESYDSIVYLTYGDTNTVYAVFDLKTFRGYPNLSGSWQNDIIIGDELMKDLKKHNPKLHGAWNK